VPDNCERGSAVCVAPEVLDTEAISQRNLLAVSVPGGRNKTIDKNIIVQHSGSDHDAKGGNPNE
tara:strand:- start:420 stop:611 length:192 start_codon:yes stop_codon:yes gene_type:complete